MILTTTQQIEGHTIREYKAPIEREKSDARINSSEREEARPKVKGVVTGEHQWNGGCHLKVFADEFNDIMDVYKNGNKKGHSSRKEEVQQS